MVSVTLGPVLSERDVALEPKDQGSDLHLEDEMDHPGDLELYSSADLIAELMRRTTFFGVVIHSEQEWKDGSWGPEQVFKVHLNKNLNTEEACRLLGAITERLEWNDV